MYTPYTEGQEPSCTEGCFYPDISCLGDELRDGRIIRITYCIRHGKHETDITDTIKKEYIEQTLKNGVRPIPSDEWREAERNRILAI